MAQRGPQMLWIGLERQHQARHVGVIERSLDSVLAAFALDLLDAPTPGLDVAGAEKRAGQQGVEWTGRMLAQQLFQGPARRQLPRVPEHDVVFIHADLDGNATAVGASFGDPVRW